MKVFFFKKKPTLKKKYFIFLNKKIFKCVYIYMYSCPFLRSFEQEIWSSHSEKKKLSFLRPNYKFSKIEKKNLRGLNPF
jgi:hypothetical protein